MHRISVQILSNPLAANEPHIARDMSLLVIIKRYGSSFGNSLPILADTSKEQETRTFSPGGDNSNL
jgi:hypothetical protein